MRLPSMPSIGDIIKMYGLSARQQLSQNFILDRNLNGRIARCCSPLLHSTVIEVGSGPGGLTRALLEGGVRHVVAVEKDERFAPALQMLQRAVGEHRMTLWIGDALQCPEEELIIKSGYKKKPDQEGEEQVHVVGNLPFAVSTELLIRWIRMLRRGEGPFRVYPHTCLTLLFQKEVAQRIVAKEGSSHYSRLSVMSQHCANVKMQFSIGSNAFVPAPDVDSGVVTLQPLLGNKMLMHDVDVDVLEHVLRCVFQQRRKMLRNAVGNGLCMGHEVLSRSQLNPEMRPDQVSVQQWGQLTRAYVQVMTENNLSTSTEKRT